MRRVALVTGSSKGLGAAIARRLASDGTAVAVNGRNSREIEVVVDQIHAQGGVAGAFPADITSEDEVAGLVGSIEAFLGPIDIIVANATGPQPEASIADVSWDEHFAQLDFFVRSPVLIGDRVIPGMIERGFGRIVLIDSDIADRPLPGRSAYATAKSAQAGLARAWAVELAPHGITVNSVTPAFIPVERHAGVSSENIDAYLAGVPAGRMGRPEDVASAVAFFSSEGAGFVTGQRLAVDGGRSLKN